MIRLPETYLSLVSEPAAASRITPSRFGKDRPSEYNLAMVNAVRQRVTVGPGGIIEVKSPDLPEGAEAEVIVLVEQQQRPSPDAAQVASRLAAFRQLQKEMNLTPESAAKWIDELRQMREEFGTRGSSQGQ